MEYGLRIKGAHDPSEALLGFVQYPNDQNLATATIWGTTFDPQAEPQEGDQVVLCPPKNPDYDWVHQVAFPRDLVESVADSLEPGTEITVRVTMGGRHFEPIKVPPKTEMDQIY